MKMQNMINAFSRKQLNVRKDDETKLSVSAPIALLVAILFTKLTIVGVVAALMMGFEFSLSEKAAEAEQAEVVKAEPMRSAPVIYAAENN